MNIDTTETTQTTETATGHIPCYNQAFQNKLLFSIFDHSGNASKPYRENGWEVIQIDIKHGTDLMTFDFLKALRDNTGISDVIPEVGIIAMIPCTAYALCGNRHKKEPARIEIFNESQILTARVKEVIDFFDRLGVLKFWQVENPMSDIHTHNKWLGKPRQKFDPCDFAGYDPNQDNSRYNKKTWLWGNFKLMEKKRIEPFEKENPGWKNLGGKSERTKELRSVTPLGFAYAFYEANH